MSIPSCRKCNAGELSEASEDKLICDRCRTRYVSCCICRNIDDEEEMIFCRYCQKPICETCISNSRTIVCAHLSCDSDLHVCEPCAAEHMEEIDGFWFCLA